MVILKEFADPLFQITAVIKPERQVMSTCGGSAQGSCRDLYLFSVRNKNTWNDLNCQNIY